MRAYYSLQYNWHLGKPGDLISAFGEKVQWEGRKRVKAIIALDLERSRSRALRIQRAWSKKLNKITHDAKTKWRV